MAEKLNIRVTQDEIQFLMESGYLCRDSGRHQQAVDIFNGVAALLPGDPTPQAAIGSVLLASGQVDEAIRQLESALKSAPNDPFTMAHLGEAFLCKKETARAKDIFEQVLAKDPQGPGGMMAKSFLAFIAEANKK